MIRRIIALFSFLGLLSMVALADTQELEINLNEQNGYSDTTALRDAADLYVTAILDYGNDQAQIKMEIKNQTEKYGLLLFNRNYTEKETKSKDWKKEFFEISWDSNLKNKGPVEATTDLSQPVFFIDLSETCVLPIQKIIGNGEAEITLAIYLCEINKRNKQSQPQKVKMKFASFHPVKINLELGPDTEFEQLKEECDAFIKTINNRSFCPCEGGGNCKMKKHHPNLDGQIKELEQSVSQETDHIRDIARNHGILVNKEIEKSKYYPLIVDIQQAFNAKVEDITNHPEKLKKCNECTPPVRKCKICGKPLGNGKNGTGAKPEKGFHFTGEFRTRFQRDEIRAETRSAEDNILRQVPQIILPGNRLHPVYMRQFTLIPDGNIQAMGSQQFDQRFIADSHAKNGHPFSPEAVQVFPQIHLFTSLQLII